MIKEKFMQIHPYSNHETKSTGHILYTDAIETCLEYSENTEKLKDLLQKIKISVLFDGIRNYFPEDKEKRQVIEVLIEREDRDNLSFNFGMSLNETEIIKKYEHSTDSKGFKKLVKVKYDLIYSILSCIASDSYCPTHFEDFCNEYGYDQDSRKAYTLFEKCLSHARKINQFFTPEELESLPR